MNLVQTTFSVIAIIFATTLAKADHTPTKVSVNFGKIYAPGGFDDNDNVQIVGEGLFSDSCYRYAETSVRVDHKTKTIKVRPVAYKYPGYCLQVILPFDRVLDVGILQKGTYTVVQESDSQHLGQVDILATKNKEPDDFMYAPISQAFFQSGGLSLMGDFPTSCMKLKEVKAQVQSDVLVIQPIVEIDSSIPCVEGKYHFETVTDVSDVKPGRYLLHVRSMNGKAVNSLVDVQ